MLSGIGIKRGKMFSATSALIVNDLQLPKGHKKNLLQNLFVTGFKNCDPAGARTRDPLIKSQMLYQLSYWINLMFISSFFGAAKIKALFLKASLNACFFIKNVLFFTCLPLSFASVP